MNVTIRLSRHGAKKKPFYKIVATDSRKSNRGMPIEYLGFFNPFSVKLNTRLNMKHERIQYWIGIGAKLSHRVACLYKEFNNSVNTVI
jgi:small subunit ribosomal protein S16